MRYSLLYFFAAALFFAAAALSVHNDGVTLRTVAGAIVGLVMVVLGLNRRRAGH